MQHESIRTMSDKVESPRKAPSRSADEIIKSAESVTFMRALIAREQDSHVRNPDDLAHAFLGPKFSLLAKMFGLSMWLCRKFYPGAPGYHLVRTRHIDGILLAALDKGIEQLVILGAGNDSRPYRFQKKLAGVRIFEVDFPGTQARKKQCLVKAFGELPKHVTFVPTDFNTQSANETLLAAGYDPTKKTFFVWEGVCFYIPESAVDRVLRLVSEHAGPGSEVVFDYSLRRFNEGDHSMYGAKGFAEWLERVGEPFLFGLNEDEIEAFVKKRGLELISDVGPEELERRYSTRANGELYLPIYAMFRMAHLRTSNAAT